MSAIALCIGLFAYWFVVGLAVVTLLHAGRSKLERQLISPAIGLGVCVIGLFAFCRLGLPVGRFCIPFAIGLGLLAIAVLAWKRPPIAWKQAWPFALILVGAFLLTGRPMARFGFDWVSYCNDDMANYALASDRFLHEGYLLPPTSADLIEGRCYGADYWFLYHAMKARPGCEMILAATAGITGLSTHDVFMPVILAFHLGLILAAAALAGAGIDATTRWDPEYVKSRDRKGAGSSDRTGPHSAEEPLPDGRGSHDAVDENTRGSGIEKPHPHGRGSRDAFGTNGAILTAALLAFSPLTTLGTLYQLIAQVSGLMLLAVTATLVFRSWKSDESAGWKPLARHAALAGVAGAALLLIYPEVVPFLAIAFAGFVIVGLIRRLLSPARLAAAVAVAALAAVALLRGYAFDVLRFMALQSQSASTTGPEDPQALLFPYYLIPEGLATLWGLLRVAEWDNVTGMPTRILVGGALLLLSIIATACLVWRGRPVAFVAGAMLALGAFLFTKHAGFGLFKLAMFVQPFLLGTIVVAWIGLTSKLARSASPREPSGSAAGQGETPNHLASIVRRLPVLLLTFVPFALLAYFQYPAQKGYLAMSYGEGTGFAEIRDPSASRVTAEFRKLIADHPAEDVIVSDSYNQVFAKFQALYTRNRSLLFPSRQYFSVIDKADQDTHWKYLNSTLAAYSADLVVRRHDQLFTRVTIPMMDPHDSTLENNFYQSELGKTSMGRSTHGMLLIETGPRQSIFNRRTFAGDPNDNFAAVPYGKVQNHGVFIVSDRGYAYYVYGGKEKARAIYPIEPDPKFFAGESMAGVGRYIVLQVLNPTDEVRVGVTLTCSYMGDGRNELPHGLAVVGANRLNFPVAGRGSMRVFSPALKPRMINGRAYVMLDMATDGIALGPNRTGLMKLYGKQFNVDRQLVGFARDISIISESEYARLAPPTRVQDFRTDKTNPLRSADLEYAGVYEDGWLSDDSYLRLTQPSGAEELVVRGMVPAELGADFKPVVTVLVDGTEIWSDTVSAAEFNVRKAVPSSADAKVREIRVRFSQTKGLPAPDNRPVGGQLLSAGFERPGVQISAGATPPSRVEGWAFDATNPLRNPGLKHAGVWEDGWIGAESSFLLTQPHAGDEVVIKGVVPGGLTPDFKAELVVLLDGREIARQPVTPAEFEIRRPGAGGSDGAAREVRLRFSGTQPLPKPDDRAVGARLSLLAFEPPRKP